MLRYIHLVRKGITKIAPILLWLVTAWFAYKLIHNGIRKFDPEGFWSPAFNRWGYPGWFRVLVGILETVGGLLVLIPKVRYLGGFILFIVMAGALITRIVNGTSLSDTLSIAHYMIFFLFLMAYDLKPQMPERY